MCNCGCHCSPHFPKEYYEGMHSSLIAKNPHPPNTPENYAWQAGRIQDSVNRQMYAKEYSYDERY